MNSFFWLQIKRLAKKIVDLLKKQSLEQNRIFLDEIKRTGRYV